eukprot:s744_g31.t1
MPILPIYGVELFPGRLICNAGLHRGHIASFSKGAGGAGSVIKTINPKGPRRHQAVMVRVTGSKYRRPSWQGRTTFGQRIVHEEDDLLSEEEILEVADWIEEAFLSQFERLPRHSGIWCDKEIEIAAGHLAQPYFKDDEIVVDRDGIRHYTGMIPSLMREYRQRAEEQRDLLKRRQRFAKKLLDALHGEAFKACEELMAEHEKLREVDGYKHIFKALQSIEKVSIVKRTEAFDRFFDAMNRRRGQPVDGYVRQRKQQWNELQDLAEGVQMSEDLKAYFMLKGAGLSREDRRMILLANQSSYTMDGIEKALRTSFYDVHEKDAPGFQCGHSRKGSGKRSCAVGSEDAASWTAVSGEEAIPEDEEDEDAFAVDGETWNDDAETCGEDQSDYGASGDDEVFLLSNGSVQEILQGQPEEVEASAEVQRLLQR